MNKDAKFIQISGDSGLSYLERWDFGDCNVFTEKKDRGGALLICVGRDDNPSANGGRGEYSGHRIIVRTFHDRPDLYRAALDIVLNKLGRGAGPAR